jgi:seryl-tRNA synthetase
MEDTIDVVEPEVKQDVKEVKEERIDPAAYRKATREAEKLRKEIETYKASKAEEENSQLNEYQKLKREVELNKSRLAEHDSYVSFLEAQRDDLLTSVPDDLRDEVMGSLDGMSPISQVKQIKTMLKLAQASSDKMQIKGAPKPINVDRSKPQTSVEPGAPRTYAEWVAMPSGEAKSKWRKLASSLP